LDAESSKASSQKAAQYISVREPQTKLRKHNQTSANNIRKQRHMAAYLMWEIKML